MIIITVVIILVLMGIYIIIPLFIECISVVAKMCVDAFSLSTDFYKDLINRIRKGK